MREILFRGFYPDENGGEKVFVHSEWIKGFWVYGYYVRFNRKEHRIYTGSYFGEYIPDYYVVLPETVGQYTGLTDKNGENIFEGDICSYENYVGVISFDEDECKFILTYDETDITDFSCIWGEELEVIGNIFENPELLEENK